MKKPDGINPPGWVEHLPRHARIRATIVHISIEEYVARMVMCQTRVTTPNRGPVIYEVDPDAQVLEPLMAEVETMGWLLSMTNVRHFERGRRLYTYLSNQISEARTELMERLSG